MMTIKAPAADSQAPDEQGEFLAHVDEGIADAKAGRVVPYERVRRWLLSWGSGKELSPPKCP